MGESYKIVYSGALKPGSDPAEVAANLAAKVGLPAAKARKLVETRQKTVLKKGLAREQAERYRDALEAMGMLVGLEPESPAPADFGLSLEPKDEPAPAAESAAGPSCPKCGSQRIENDSCLDCGIILSKYRARLEREAAAASEPVAADPYAAPGADLGSEAEQGAMTGPNRVPAGHGWAWVARGFWHWKQNPFAWIFALILWMVVLFLTGLIPLAGFLAISLLGPVFMAGFAIGADAQDDGEPFSVGHLFAGFSQNFGQLVLVGLLYMLGSVLVMVVIGAMMVGAFTALGGIEAMQTDDPEVMMAVMSSPSFYLAMLVGMALMIPLMMTFWFAPSLVALNDIPALTAMKLSFLGCIKNILPFLLYGLIAFVLMLIAVIPFGLGLLILSPVLIASIYAGYRDIYFG
jgi:uncharacterized membrane protein/ribosomal protein L32